MRIHLVARVRDEWIARASRFTESQSQVSFPPAAMAAESGKCYWRRD
jgi:hypothetical protein